MSKTYRILILLAAILLTAAITFCVTYYCMMNAKTPPAAPAVQSTSDIEPEPDPEAGYDKLREIRELIDTYYIGDVDEKQMSDSLAKGMIEGIGDEWSYYIPEESYAGYLENVKNSYVGIGVTIMLEQDDRGFLITDVTPESPAYRAGIVIGDVLTGVEGESVLELGMEETKNRIRGEEGTDVTITVIHDGESVDHTVTRATINIVNVTSEPLEHGLTYIKIRNFEEHTADDAIRAIEEAVDAGTTGIVFDVRFNPGGLKAELVKLLDYLLPEGPLFRSVRYDGSESVDTSDASYLDLPMAVLVNKDSYSAAEFFAAALQEYEAAKVVGTQTYGKGYFQTSFQLSDGSAINISIGKYTTPKGKSLVGEGITPDKVVEVSDETYSDLYYNKVEKADDEQLQAAISLLTP